MRQIAAVLQQYSVLDQTYFFFSSDHGFHMGQHCLGACKREPCVRVAFRHASAIHNALCMERKLCWQMLTMLAWYSKRLCVCAYAACVRGCVDAYAACVHVRVSFVYFGSAADTVDNTSVHTDLNTIISQFNALVHVHLL